MKKPKVSIVTISYNHERYIRAALDGFVNQKTDFTYEVIIADDCSTDGTQAIISEYAEKYPDIIKPILRAKNIGAQKNSIDALRSATGSYVALCEGDDYWTDVEKLQKQADFLDAHTDYSLCFHSVQVSFESGGKKDYLSPTHEERKLLTGAELLHRNFIHTCSVMYRWQDYSALPDDVMPLDWYLHLYHAKFGKIGFIDKNMATYRRHPGGIWWDSFSNMEGIWKKHGVSWLALYVELLKLYGENKEDRAVLEGSIITLFNTLAKLDDEHDTNLVEEATLRYPKSSYIFIHNLRKAVEELSKHSNAQADIIKHYVDLSRELSHENEVLAAEVAKFEARRLVKLGDKIRNHVSIRKPQ